MQTLLVSYDLIRPENSEDYKRLGDRIKQFPNWAKPLESVWIIQTADGPAAVRDALKPYIESNDKLIVVEMSGSWASFNIGTEVSSWLNQFVA